MRKISEKLAVKRDGKLDFGRFMHLSSIYFAIVFLFLVVFNTVYAIRFDPKYSTWEEILGSLDPAIAFVALLVPNIQQISQDLVVNGYPDRAEVVVRVYSINWIVIIAALFVLTPAIITLSVKMLRADIVVPRVDNSWFERDGTEQGYLRRMACANICLGAFVGLAFLIFISFEQVTYNGNWFDNTVDQDNHQLNRPAFFWITSIFFMIWSFLWIVIYLRVKIRDMEGIYWRDANSSRKHDRRPVD